VAAGADCATRRLGGLPSMAATASDSGRTLAGRWSKYPPHPASKSATPKYKKRFDIESNLPVRSNGQFT
jgi:hypothetical protein